MVVRGCVFTLKFLDLTRRVLDLCKRLTPPFVCEGHDPFYYITTNTQRRGHPTKIVYKMMKVCQRNYIEPGEVNSLTHFFL